PEERRAQIDPRVAAPQAPSLASRYDDMALARVDDALDLLSPLFIRLDPLGEELHEAIDAVELAFTGPFGPPSDIPDVVRRSHLGARLLRLAELIHNAAHDLHVLLRHCPLSIPLRDGRAEWSYGLVRTWVALLRQPGGFEGVFPRQEALD